MINLILILVGMCTGTIVGMGIMFALMGPKLRDQFLGYNLENKPIIIDWMDGHTKDFQIMMRGVTVFTGVIRTMELGRGTNSSNHLRIDIVSKAEVMRDFSS